MDVASWRHSRRNARDRTLAAWSNGERVGTWSVQGGEHRFQYDGGWLASPARRPLSLSLPFTPGNLPHRGAVVRNFFDNLLPDSHAIRRRLAERFAKGSIDSFDLLAAVGRDCAGAVQLLPPDKMPEGFDRIDAVTLDEAGVERAIDNALSGARVPGPEDDEGLRVCMPGEQEKTALLRHAGHWCRPLNSTPTTHILKLPLGLIGNIRADMADSVENEWLCCRLLARLGLPVPAGEIATFGRHKVLVLERFDRALQSPPDQPQWIARLPLEDCCQALGFPAEHKYESDGGPGLRDILRILDASTRAAQDKRTFVHALLAFWLLAAADAHAKKVSIFLERGGGYRMTPLYDVISAWPIVGDGPDQIAARRVRLALALRGKNAHYLLYEIRTRHWEALALQSGVPDMFDQMVALVLQVPHALDQMEAQLPTAFPRPLFAAVRAGMLAQAERFMDEL